MSIDRPVKPEKPSGRKALFLGAGIIAAMVSCCLVGSYVIPVFRVRKATTDIHESFMGVRNWGGALRLEDERHVLDTTVSSLGGKEAALAQLRLYVSLSDWAAPRRQVAASVMSACGRPAARVLAPLLKDRDPLVRRYAARSLCVMGADAADAVPELIEALGDIDDAVKYFAAGALGAIGPAAQEAIPELTLLLLNNDVRFIAYVCDYPNYYTGAAGYAACYAIGRVDPDGDRAVTAYLQALKCPNRRTQGLIISSLGRMGKRARSALPELQRIMERENVIALKETAKVREEMRKNDGFRPISICTDDTSWDWGLLMNSAEAIWKIRGETGRETDVLLSHLQDNLHLAGLLSKMSVSSRRIVAVVGPLMSHKDYSVRYDAKRTLVEILGSDFEQVNQVLGQVYSEYIREGGGQAEIAEGVKKMGGTAKTISKLGAYLAVPGISGDDRYLSAILLGRCGREAYPLLLKMLDDTDDGVRMRSAYALGDLGAEAKGAVDKLRAVARGGGEFSPNAAASALGSIGPAAKAAIPELEALAKHDDKDMRATAEYALIRIRGRKVVWQRFEGSMKPQPPSGGSSGE